MIDATFSTMTAPYYDFLVFYLGKTRTGGCKSCCEGRAVFSLKKGILRFTAST